MKNEIQVKEQFSNDNNPSGDPQEDFHDRTNGFTRIIFGMAYKSATYYKLTATRMGIN